MSKACRRVERNVGFQFLPNWHYEVQSAFNNTGLSDDIFSNRRYYRIVSVKQGKRKVYKNLHESTSPHSKKHRVLTPDSPNIDLKLANEFKSILWYDWVAMTHPTLQLVNRTTRLSNTQHGRLLGRCKNLTNSIASEHHKTKEETEG